MNDQILAKARVKHDARKYGEAIKLYQMILMKKPADLDANYLLGTAYAETGKLEQAKKYLLKAENISPDSPFIKVNIGNVYKELGEYERAFESYIHALEIQHDLPEARQNLGIVIGMIKEGKSETAATKCLEYGHLCMCDGRNDEALAMLVVGNHLYPENIPIRYFMTILEGDEPDEELQKKFAESECSLQLIDKPTRSFNR